MPIRKMQDVDLAGKTVVIREDLNVPMKDGGVSNDKRIRAALPTIRLALEKGAGVVLLSHLGRPTEGQFEEQFSLKPVAARLAELLERPVRLAPTFAEATAAPGEVTLLENVRFLKGEKKNDAALAARLAGLGQVYVMDAFGAAHRAHASTEGAVRAAQTACAGPLLQAELEAFGKVLDNPARPLSAAPRSAPSWACWKTCSTPWTCLWWAAALPIPFWPPPGIWWARAFVRKTWCPKPKRLWSRPRP